MDILYLIILAMFLFIGYYNLNKKNDKDDVEPKKKRYVSNATRLFTKQIPHSLGTDTILDKPKTTDLEIKVLCIDRSGSMTSFGNEVIGGVDSYFKTINQNHPNIKLSIITFDDIIETPCFNELLTDQSELKAKWIEPRGCTALRDGILASIQCAESMLTKNNAKDVEIEIVVFTDGMENASEKISHHKLKSVIKKYKMKGWTFTFLAANQDAVATGSRFGFDAGRSMTTSVGKQNYTWERAGSKNKFTKNCRMQSTSHKDRHYVQ